MAKDKSHLADDELTEEELAQLRRRLESLRDAFLETGSGQEGPVELDQSRQGRLSRMDAIQGQLMSEATAQRRELELKRIIAAIRRMDSGDYGFCLDCEEPISRRRLKANPASPYCIACVEKREQR